MSRTNAAWMLIGFAIALASCGGSSRLSEDIRADAAASVRFTAALTGVELSDVDATCAADRLGDDVAQALIDAADSPDSSQIALVLDEAITCVGATQIAISAIAPQAPTASPESIMCAAEEFDSELLVGLLAGTDDGDPTLGPRLELELASALATCLSPEELLELGG